MPFHWLARVLHGESMVRLQSARTDSTVARLARVLARSSARFSRIDDDALPN